MCMSALCFSEHLGSKLCGLMSVLKAVLSKGHVMSETLLPFKADWSGVLLKLDFHALTGSLSLI